MLTVEPCNRTPGTHRRTPSRGTIRSVSIHDVPRRVARINAIPTCRRDCRRFIDVSGWENSADFRQFLGGGVGERGGNNYDYLILIRFVVVVSNRPLKPFTRLYQVFSCVTISVVILSSNSFNPSIVDGVSLLAVFYFGS